MSPIYARIQQIFQPEPFDQQIDALAEILNLSRQEVLAIEKDPRITYRPFTINKRGRGRRSIAAPTGHLKKIQRSLLHNCLAGLPVHDCSFAFRAGCSTINHAQTHSNQTIVLTADLKDFFASTSAARIREFFVALGWRNESLKILERISVFRGGLPQGAPTSPALSNVVNYELDFCLHEFAAINGAAYSRYADDLAFSWPHSDEPMPFRSSVTGLLGRFGYRIQPDKGWRLQYRKDQPELTGIAICGNRLRPSKALAAERKRLAWRWLKTPLQRRHLLGLNAYARHLRGKR